jgi:CheY-like chemotaxis protein
MIVMDLGIPDTDGLNLTKTIRNIEKSDDTYIPIVMLTTHSDKEYRETCKQIGIDDYILKPLTPAKASEILQRYVVRHLHSTLI